VCSRSSRLVIYRLYSRRFENWLNLVYLRLSERIVLSSIGDGLRALVRWHCCQHLAIAHQQILNGDGDVVYALDPAVEDGRSAPSAFEHRIAVAVGDDRRGFGQKAGVRANGEINVIHRNELGVVGGHLFRGTVVRDDVELYLAPQQAATLIDLVGPKFITLLKRFAIVGKVA
jgi:hypothetical protein